MTFDLNKLVQSNESQNQAFLAGVKTEQKRIVDLLLNLNVIRRDGVLPLYVAFDTDGEKVIYLTGLEDVK
jgi:hypothetical protein